MMWAIYWPHLEWLLHYCQTTWKGLQDQVLKHLTLLCLHDTALLDRRDLLGVTIGTAPTICFLAYLLLATNATSTVASLESLGGSSFGKVPIVLSVQS